MASGILDTSTLILLGQISDNESLPEEPLITTVTLAELSVGPLVATNQSEQAARQAHLQLAEADFVPLPFDSEAARSFGQVAASLRHAAPKTKARTFDAMIAAIAISRDLPLHTCDQSDFAGIDGLDVVVVSHPNI